MKSVSKPWGGLILLIACYTAIYGGLLWYTHGLPYVLDNNESFSSLWHSYNLYHFDISRSMGLADETFAYHAAAHPFVHTHQGNFPRLFAFLIFVLGASSVQSQIVVTTFTVGLAGVVLAYVFFSRIADPLLATIFCLLLITDYVLVAQWQVVTYRVWHLFFVFSSLLCVHLLPQKKALGIALTVLNFACLFYYELVFVFFVSLSCALYAATYLRKRWADVATFCVSQALGAVIALGVLVTQLTLYMGWEDALRDFRFTFLGRNYLSNSEGIARSALEFYESHNIAFWYNLEDGANFRSLRYFVGSLTYFEFQVHTPYWTTLCFALLFGVLAGLFLGRLRATGQTGGMWASDAHSDRLELRLAAWAALVLSCCLLAGVALAGDTLLGAIPSSRLEISFSLLAVAIAALIALAVWALVRGYWGQPAGTQKKVWPAAGSTATLVWVACVLYAIAALVVVSPHLYGQRYSALWMEIANGTLPRPVLQLTFFAVALVSCALALGNPAAVHWSRCSQAVRGLLPFWIAGLIAYAVTFYLSPAYIFSGYRFRAAPFTVFHTTTLSALALYPLVLYAIDALSSQRQSAPSAGQPNLPSGQLVAKRSATAKRWPGLLELLCVAVLAAMSVYWVGAQMTYIKVLAPQHYGFLRVLSEPPFRGATFVVNGYAAPIAAATHNWAFLDENLVRNVLVIAAGSNELQMDTKYLWFADKRSNLAYRRPDYFICIAQQSLYAMAEQAWRRAGAGAGWQNGCEKHQLVRIARGQQVGGFNPQLELAGADLLGPAEVGYERWAIVKLNWAAASKTP